MNRSRFRYQPDEWAHDLDQWWVPLASLVARSGCGSEAWRSVLGVEEFFDHRLLEQAACPYTLDMPGRRGRGRQGSAG